MNRVKLLGIILFNVGFFTLFWGAFELAYQLGIPIWSGTFGWPILHHYIIGAILTYIAFLLMIKEELIEGVNKCLHK